MLLRGGGVCVWTKVRSPWLRMFPRREQLTWLTSRVSCHCVKKFCLFIKVKGGVFFILIIGEYLKRPVDAIV